MPQTSRPVVTSAPTLIATAARGAAGGGDDYPLEVLVKNKTGTASIYLGDSDVSDSTGFEWAVIDGAFETRLDYGESLYGVASVDQTLHVIAVRTG